MIASPKWVITSLKLGTGLRFHCSLTKETENALNYDQEFSVVAGAPLVEKDRLGGSQPSGMTFLSREGSAVPSRGWSPGGEARASTARGQPCQSTQSELPQLRAHHRPRPETHLRSIAQQLLQVVKVGAVGDRTQT